MGFTGSSVCFPGIVRTRVAHTGVVPIVYKAQHTLLNSLVISIFWAFVMIAGVMVFLLGNWERPFKPLRAVNLGGGALSMLPNVFPVVLVFGAMGHLGIVVDIGSMMCAGVAMGVAVDDTIHFLTWFRNGEQIRSYTPVPTGWHFACGRNNSSFSVRLVA